MPKSEAYNTDCLAYMKSLPDNAFDLLLADPPYGGGFTEGGGCKAWFAKYHQNTEEKPKRYAEIYEGDSSQSVHVERERERTRAV